jgi:capsular polysaccharide transport system ATP-binding protein
MITLNNVSKSYQGRTGVKHVLNSINLSIGKGEKVGILGRNGAGKSTLIRLISGAESPSSGVIDRKMSISWPLAFGGGFQGSLTGFDNLRFICRIYGQPYEKAKAFVEDFSELGNSLREPLKTYSSGMRARLDFGISMAIEFDCFLIDEVVAVGDARFHQKCHHELFEQRKDRAMILVSHNMGYISQHCDRAAILQNGALTMFDDIGTAADVYNQMAC